MASELSESGPDLKCELAPGASAVPENRPLKLITFNLSVALRTSNCTATERLSRSHSRSPMPKSRLKFGRIRPRSSVALVLADGKPLNNFA